MCMTFAWDNEVERTLLIIYYVITARVSGALSVEKLYFVMCLECADRYQFVRCEKKHLGGG